MELTVAHLVIQDITIEKLHEEALKYGFSDFRLTAKHHLQDFTSVDVDYSAKTTCLLIPYKRVPV